ncbi:MAG: class IV adenylate cyclase [Clostridia bacterium]|nr:class IV adenylate cyclase [Clostridia bacterium]
MKEIEILVTFDNEKEDVLKKLDKFEYIGDKDIYDTYYVDDLRENLKPESNLRTNEVFRIRRKETECLVTYKKNHFEGNRWIYSDEYETKADDYKIMEKIVEMLGLKTQIKIYNKRKIYKYKDYEIVFEDVEDLGYFIEVEKILESDDEQDIKSVKKEIRNFIYSMGLENVRELDMGKNQLMLRKLLNREDINIYVDEE